MSKKCLLGIFDENFNLLIIIEVVDKQYFE